MAFSFVVLTAVARSATAQDTTTFPTTGKVVRHDAALDALLAEDAKIEVLAGGFQWSEGPVWVPRDGGFLLFSDIPNNRVMKWVEGEGVSVFLEPAGYTGASAYGKERGSNGLGLDPRGNLTLCEHGDRRVARLDWDGGKQTIVDNYDGKRFNSPNDHVWAASGDLFFTDPPYGLPG
ncbi:MAG: SMP-30/gluconolactonase/LRE family protein, partial [Planctomycetota bacterium]